jgi:hypothetical protein
MLDRVGTAVKTWVVAALALLALVFFTDLPDRVAAGWPGIYCVAGEISAAVHVLAFLALSLVMLAARWPLGPAAAVLALLALAGGTELGQTMVPQRVPDPDDFFLDVVGIAAGAVLWWGLVSGPLRRPSKPGLPEPETIPLPQSAASRRKAA